MGKGLGGWGKEEGGGGEVLEREGLHERVVWGGRLERVQESKVPAMCIGIGMVKMPPSLEPYY